MCVIAILFSNVIPEVVSRTDAAGRQLLKSVTQCVSKSDFSQWLIHTMTSFIHLSCGQPLTLTLLKTARKYFT